MEFPVVNVFVPRPEPESVVVMLSQSTDAAAAGIFAAIVKSAGVGGAAMVWSVPNMRAMKMRNKREIEFQIDGEDTGRLICGFMFSPIFCERFTGEFLRINIITYN